MSTIIGLTGYARSGKDTVGKILTDHYGFHRVAFGDVLKAVAEDVNPYVELGHNDPDVVPYLSNIEGLLEAFGDWENVKDECPPARQFLVDLGNSLRKRIPGVESSVTFAAAQEHTAVVNTNVYHREEIEQIQAAGGIVLRVVRPGIGPANEDERRTGSVTVDGTVVNDGSLDKLHVNLDLVLRHLNVREASRG